MNQLNYLDFYDLLVNELIGDVMLFILLGLVLLWVFATKLQVPVGATAIMSIVFIGMVLTVAFSNIWYVMTVFIVGAVFYLALSRVWKRS